MPEFVIVDGDDWLALYRNNLIVTQGHQITAEDVLIEMGVSFERREAFAENGEFPRYLSDVKS